MWPLHVNDANDDEDGDGVVDGRMTLNLDRRNVAAAVVMLRDADVAAGTNRPWAIDVISGSSITVRW